MAVETLAAETSLGRCLSFIRRQSIVRHGRSFAKAFALAAFAASSVQAQTTDTIDKPITIYVAGTAGGGIDLYARIVARHLGKHIPGNPPVNVQVMPGAGGIRAANFLVQQAPKDGTVMTTFAGGPILEPLIGARDPGYDMSQFTWVGAVTKDVGLCLALKNTPFKTIDDARRQQMVVAGTGAGSETDTWPIVLNEVLGTRFKLVTGYLGTQETIIAMERGEAHGRCVFSLSSVKTAKPDWLRDKLVNVLVVTALERHPELPDVPTAVELTTRPDDRALVELLVGPGSMARPFAAPPGVAPARAATLRRAFDATMKDPEFAVDAGKIQADLQPTTGEGVQKLVGRMYATPRPVIDRAKKLFAPPQ